MLFHALDCRFGRLNGRFVFPSGGLVLVLEENEQGKTTLVEALLAALYGYSRGERGAGVLLERRRYLPVDGSSCYVDLELTTGGRRLSIRRELDGGAAERVRVIDLGTGRDVTPEMAPTKGGIPIGERLLGLDREQFLKICFVRQGEIGQIREAGSLKAPVEKLVDSAVGDATAAGALNALDDAMRHYRGETLAATGQIDTEIRRLTEQLHNARSQQQGLQARRDGIDGEARRLDQLDADDRAAAEHQEALLFLADRAELARLQSEKQMAEEQTANREALRAKITALEPYRRVPDDAAARLDAIRIALDEAQRLRGGAAAEQQRCASELTAEQARLDRMGPVAAWHGAEHDEVVTWRDRLLLALSRYTQAEAAWQDSLRNAGAEAERLYRDAVSPFDRLSDEERRTLLSYPQRAAEFKLTLHGLQPQEISAAKPAGGGYSLPLLVAGAVIVFLGLILLFLKPAPGAAIALIGLLMAVAGFRTRSGAAVDEAAIEARTLARREMLETQDRLQQLDDEAARLADLVGADGAAEAAKLLQAYLAAQGPAADLRAKQELIQGARGDLTAAREMIADLCTRAGDAHEAAAIGALDADRLLGLVGDAIAQQGRVEQAQTSLARANVALASADAKVGTCRQEWARRCAELEVPDSDAGAALGMAREMVEQRRLLDRAEAQLRALSGQAERRDTPATPDRLHELGERIAAAAAAMPKFAALPLDRSESNYRDEAQAIQAKRETDQRQRLELRERIGRVLDDFRTQMPQALETEQTVERRLGQVCAYRDALDLARATLDEVARESHRSWSEILNAYAGNGLQRLAPRYAEVRFSEQLEVDLRDVDGNHWSPADGRLSSGVRDRIYLAVRLALADYFSKADDPLPLILDDPLMTSDDEQFTAAMRFILEDIAARHQVILTSCHGQRHRALMQQAPELWQEHAAVLPLSDGDLLRV